MRHMLLLALAVVGCGTETDARYVADFHPPEVAAGYTRYLTPPTRGIAPGDDIEICQWVEGPSDQARDVLAITGLQSRTGHHAVLYATSATQYAVGESRICTEQDTLAISFVGAIGGEGTAASAAQLPEGLFFRVPAGQALMINTHW